MLFLNGNKNRYSTHFKEVFDDYFQTIVCFAIRYVHSSEAAEDIVQESFIELWHSDIAHTDIVRMKAFLYLTTRNKAINYLKHQKITENYFLHYRNKFETERFYLDQLIEQETVHLVHRAIDKLPEQSKNVVLLRLEGLKNKEIAEKIGISVETVKYHKTRAFKILKDYLKDNILLLLPLF